MAEKVGRSKTGFTPGTGLGGINYNPRMSGGAWRQKARKKRGYGGARVTAYARAKRAVQYMQKHGIRSLESAPQWCQDAINWNNELRQRAAEARQRECEE